LDGETIQGILTRLSMYGETMCKLHQRKPWELGDTQIPAHELFQPASKRWCTLVECDENVIRYSNIVAYRTRVFTNAQFARQMTPAFNRTRQQYGLALHCSPRLPRPRSTEGDACPDSVFHQSLPKPVRNVHLIGILQDGC
jgi:hypothetical protein